MLYLVSIHLFSMEWCIMKTILEKSKLETIDFSPTVDYMVKKITDIVEKIGPRAPGSKEELAAQESMGEDLKEWSDEITIEEFTVHRQAFMGFIPFTVAMALAATVLYWVDYPLIAFLCTVLGIIPLVLEFLMYKRFLDPLFIGKPFLSF